MKVSKHKHTQEVEKTLHMAAKKQDLDKSEKLKLYIGTQLHVVGLNSKTQVDINKKGFDFYSENKEKTFSIFDAIYKNSHSLEGKNQAFIYLDKHYKNISLDVQLEILPHWIKHVDNWAHSDNLSKFLTRLVEDDTTRKKILPVLKTWNNSSNLWERRQSLVSLFYYARTKNTHIDFSLSKQMILPLIHDKEYFVQKAVGWTLRESFNAYPKETYQFITQHIKQISPTAFTTCLEKMTESQKQALKQKRK